MNCRSAQQLISPYLDQQLTGTEMLAMQQHLKKCTACAEEYRQVREVRRLLRSLSAVAPGQPLEARITQQIVTGPGSRWGFVPHARLFGPASELLLRPQQRGQRLAGALALSCLALLALAAPFAPSTSDAARAGRTAQVGVLDVSLAQGQAVLPPAFARTGGGHLLLGQMGDPGSVWGAPQRSGGTLSRGSAAAVTLSGWSAEPLDDEAVGGYAAGDAALTESSGQ